MQSQVLTAVSGVSRIKQQMSPRRLRRSAISDGLVIHYIHSIKHSRHVTTEGLGGTADPQPKSVVVPQNSHAPEL